MSSIGCSRRGFLGGVLAALSAAACGAGPKAPLKLGDLPLKPLSVKALTDLAEPFFVMEANPTAENIARLIYDYAVSQSFPVREVRLWETPTSFAAYGPDA